MYNMKPKEMKKVIYGLTPAGVMVLQVISNKWQYIYDGDENCHLYAFKVFSIDLKRVIQEVNSATEYLLSSRLIESRESSEEREFFKLGLKPMEVRLTDLGVKARAYHLFLDLRSFLEKPESLDLAKYIVEVSSGERAKSIPVNKSECFAKVCRLEETAKMIDPHTHNLMKDFYNSVTSGCVHSAELQKKGKDVINQFDSLYAVGGG